MQFVVASHNNGKIREFNDRLQPVGVELISVAEFTNAVPNETGLTFVENALIKARHASEISGLPALADDSGLVVPALNGQPGIYSARYAGEQATDAMNRQHLLHELSAIPGVNRRAYFYCALVLLMTPADPMPLISTASWAGVIATKECGDRGFGYDPLFYLPELGKTAAELTPTIKNNISHRGQAIDQLLRSLANAKQTA